MVPNSRATTRTDQLRPINRPRPLGVQEEEGVPRVLIDRERRYPVAQIQESWRIDDEWWREPISRRYYRVVLGSGAIRTIYHDLITDCWYEQAY